MTEGPPTAEEAARRYLERYDIGALVIKALTIRARVSPSASVETMKLLAGTDIRLHAALPHAFTDDTLDAFARAQVLVQGLTDYLSRLEERGLLKGDV